MGSLVNLTSALGVPGKKIGVVHPAQFFIPERGTAYHDEILLKITRAWYSSWRGTHFVLRISQYSKRVLSHFFVVLIVFVFLVFPGFSGVQGLEDDFVKMCGWRW